MSAELRLWLRENSQLRQYRPVRMSDGSDIWFPCDKNITVKLADAAGTTEVDHLVAELETAEIDSDGNVGFER